MTMRRLAAPWAPAGSRAYCLPGSVLLKLRMGEAPEAVPARNDVRDRAAAAATALDCGPIDRMVRQRAGQGRFARLHTAAANIGRTGARNQGYSDAEQVTGLARTFLLRTPAATPVGDLVDALSAIPTVEWASPNYVAAAPFDVQGAFADMPADEDGGWSAWTQVRGVEALAYEPGDPAVIVGVIDSGVTATHPEFARPFRRGYDTVNLVEGDVAPGVTLLGERPAGARDPIDHFVGHGSACAGIIGAAGFGMPPGLAGEAQLLPMRALGAVRLPGRAEPVGMGAIADLDAAAKLAIDLGARVLNLSFGTDDDQLSPHLPKPHADIIAYAEARGVTLVAASGNNGRRTVYWPAAYPSVIAVGAVGANARPTDFSTTGDHVAVSAPGERVLTPALEGYQHATGTSFAAPFVTAVTALMIARASRRAFPLPPETIARLLIETVRPFGAGPPPEGCGAGVLDALAALQAVDRLVDRERMRSEDG